MLLNYLAGHFLALPRSAKRFLVLSLDASLCVFSLWLTLCLQFETLLVLEGPYLTLMLVSLALSLPLFSLFGFYQTIFRHANSNSMLSISIGVGLYGLVFAMVYSVIGVAGVPRLVGVSQPLMLMLFIVFSRSIARYWLGYRVQMTSGQSSRVLIYGAGAAGRQLAAGIKNCVEMQVVGMLDDDESMHGNVLNGIRIYNPVDLVQVVHRTQANQVFLAMPSVSRTRRNAILHEIRKTRVSVRTLPSLMDLAHGRVKISDLRDLEIDDLLEREPVPADPMLLSKNVLGKVVLVTGAGGSIGSELCRQIFKVGPHTLLMLDLNEFALYRINSELEQFLAAGKASIKLVSLLADVRDASCVKEILSVWRPDVVYHAAAYKHVPLVEHNVVEGVKNNVLGTLVMAQQSMDHGVGDFVFVSTDKAVRPTNVMGASKRLVEMVLQAYAATFHGQKGKTCFSMVRFGNVLGSSGSVVPKFRDQIKNGGPITLTHTEITRYFMTIPEAAQLVIQAGAMATGGDVFLLDMGKPIKIIELARRMIELSGLCVRDEENPHGDIAIEVTGLRPGEKLYEELLVDGNPLPTGHPLIWKAHERYMPLPELQVKLDLLNAALDVNDVPLIRVLLQELIPDYQPDDEIVDWCFLEKRLVASQQTQK